MTSQEHNIHTTNNVHKGVVILAHTQGWQSVKRTHTSATCYICSIMKVKGLLLASANREFLFTDDRHVPPEYMHHWRQGYVLTIIHAGTKNWNSFYNYEKPYRKNLSITTLKFWFWRNIHEDFLYRWLQMAGIPITCKPTHSSHLPFCSA